jgi:ERCC4-type nuclease
MSITAAIIDSREPEWAQRLGFNGAMVATSLLDAGDLLATCDDGTLLAIERKTPDDLLNSIRDNRLWAQLVGIRNASPWAYLLITGELRHGADGNVVTNSRSSGWSWAAVQGALLQAQEMGVFVTYCASNDDYEATVLRLSKRSHNAEVIVPPARDPRVMNDAERLLTALPGIGYERVQPLLEYAGTPAWALTYLTDLEANGPIPGIGAGIKRAVRKALKLEDDQELSVILNGQPINKEA